MNEQELLKRIAELPREIEPGSDPWEKIAARLDEKEGAQGSGPAPSIPWLRGWPARAVAALAVLAIAVAVLMRPGLEMEAPVSTQTAGNTGPAMGMPVVLAGSEAEYQAAFREFITVGASHEQIPALTVEKIETGWADLRQIETALTDALVQNPDDPFLNKRMLELRARQLGFLRQLASLDHSNRRLTI